MEIFRSVTPLVEPLVPRRGVPRRLRRGPPAGPAGRDRSADPRPGRRRAAASPARSASRRRKFVAKLASTRAKPDGMLVVPGDRDRGVPAPAAGRRAVGGGGEDRGGAGPARPAHRRRPRPHPGRHLRRALGPGRRRAPARAGLGPRRAPGRCPTSRRRASAPRRPSPATSTTRTSCAASCCGCPSGPRPGCVRRRWPGAPSTHQGPVRRLHHDHPRRTLRDATDVGARRLRHGPRALRRARARPGPDPAGRRPGRGAAPRPGRRRASCCSASASTAGARPSRRPTGPRPGSGRGVGAPGQPGPDGERPARTGDPSQPDRATTARCGPPRRPAGESGRPRRRRTLARDVPVLDLMADQEMLIPVEVRVSHRAGMCRPGFLEPIGRISWSARRRQPPQVASRHEEEPVPLSEHEQRLLEQMERALYAEDPKFASALRGKDPRSNFRRRILLAVVGFIVGIVLLMTGLVTQVILVSILGFVAHAGQRVLRASPATARSPPPPARGRRPQRGPTLARRERRPSTAAGRPGLHAPHGGALEPPPRRQRPLSQLRSTGPAASRTTQPVTHGRSAGTPSRAARRTTRRSSLGRRVPAAPTDRVSPRQPLRRRRQAPSPGCRLPAPTHVVDFGSAAAGRWRVRCGAGAAGW